MKTSKYVSKQSDDNGIIQWTEDENHVWHELITRQLKCVEGKACDEFMQGLEQIQLPTDRVPQLGEVSKVLYETTGWQCEEVPALINFDRFFNLLAEKKFPVATFIRKREEFEYLQEPDIFHEIFGHCAMLTHPAFANFTHVYGKLGKAAEPKDRVWLARLYWFTVEFGLIHQHNDIRIYGGGILSSPGETNYAYSSHEPLRKDLDPLDVLRTPYRIDIMQPIYFMINHMDDLFDLANLDIMTLVEKAKALGLHEPLYPPKTA